MRWVRGRNIRCQRTCVLINFTRRGRRLYASRQVLTASVCIPGNNVVVINPAPANSGILFSYIEADGDQFKLTIAASPENVVRSDHGTTLGNAFGATVATVEHLLAALAISRIDNAFIEFSGPEMPILDGSAAPFLEGIRNAGRQVQPASQAIYEIEEPLHIVDGDRAILIEPAEGFSLSVEIEFEDCMIGCQSLSVTLSEADEIARIASARTFCRLYEVDAMPVTVIVDREGNVRHIHQGYKPGYEQKYLDQIRSLLRE